MDTETKKAIILDHYEHPINNSLEGIDDSYIKVNSKSESCIDNIDLYVKIEDNIIKDVRFVGEACAISTASTSIMIKNMIGKNVSEIEEYITNFYNMLNEEPYEDKNFAEAVVFDETYKQGNRKTCVTIPYQGIEKAIKENKES